MYIRTYKQYTEHDVRGMFFNINYGMWLTCPLEQDVSAPDLLPLQNIHTICFVHFCNRAKNIMSTMPHVLCFMCAQTLLPHPKGCVHNYVVWVTEGSVVMTNP